MNDPTSVLTPSTWVELARADLDAGASAVLTEGRESGVVGLYAADGSVRGEVVDALLDGIGAHHLIFEAPHRHQQAWLIRRIGPDVNLVSRIEQFCRQLDRNLIMSQALAEQLERPVWEIGHYELRGFSKLQRLFELPEE